MPPLEEELKEASEQVGPGDDEEEAGEELASTEAAAADTSDTLTPEDLKQRVSGDGGPRKLTADELKQRVRQQDEGVTDDVMSRVEEAETGGVPEEERDRVRSSQGAVGRIQIQPETAVQPGFGVEPLAEDEEEAEELLEDPEINRDFGRKYLGALRDEFGSTRNALVAYNWGPTKAREWIEQGEDVTELPEETRDYITKILPKAERGAQALEEAGIPIDELNLFSALDADQQPEDRVAETSTFDQASDKAKKFFRAGYNYITTLGSKTLERAGERGIGTAIEAGGRGIEFLERSADAVAERIVDVAELSATPEGVDKEDRRKSDVSYADELLGFPIEAASDLVLAYSDTFQKQRSEVDFSGGPASMLSAENLGAVMGEQGPLAVGMIAGVATNPVIGTAAIGAVEGGSYLHELDRLEKQNPDVNLSEEEKLMGAAAVGSVNMALERLGINRILKSARVPGVKSKIFNVLFGAATESATEAGQELTNILGQDYQVEDASIDDLKSLRTITDQDLNRLAHAAYGGGVIGFGLSTIGATTESLIEKTEPDADLIDIQYDEEGRPQPIFRPRQHVDLEGNATREELEDAGLDVPRYRVDMLREDWRNTLNESLDDSRFEDEQAKREHVDRVVNAALILEDQKAAAKGVELETYLEENKVTPHRGGIITEDVLEQFVGRKADMLQTERRALSRAQELERQGFDDDTIYETTGWYRNPHDEKWRMEVPAHTMEFKELSVRMSDTNQDRTYSMDEVVDTDHRIFELYPELKDVEVRLDNEFKGGSSFEHRVVTDAMSRINLNIGGQWRKTFWHELQHAIQYIEGFGRGASNTDRNLLRRRSSEAMQLLDRYDNLKEKLFDLRDPRTEGAVENFEEINQITEELNSIDDQLAQIFDKEDISDAIQESYRNVSGEIEARAAALRDHARNILQSNPEKFEEMMGEIPEEGEMETPVESLEKQSDPTVQTLIRLYDNPVRSQLNREGKSKLLQEDNNRKKGAFQQTRDGRRLIQLFEKADESTIPHEMMHLFRRTLSSEQDAEIRRQLDINEWNREAEEKFARAFERYLAEGRKDAPNAELRRVFNEYEDWMTNIYGSIQGSPIDVDVSEGVRNFFDNMFERRVQTEEGRNFFQRKIMDYFQVENRFRRIGQPDTGRLIKGHQTFVDMKINQGKALVNEVARTLESEEGLTKHAWKVLRGQEEQTSFRERTTDAVLAAESDEIYENSPEDVQRAADKLRQYFDKAQREYQVYGRIPQGFHDRLAQEIEAQVEQLKEEGELTDEQTRELNQLQDQLRKVEDLNFVHIPVDAFFRTIKDSSPDQLRRLVKLMADRERETLSIKDMIEDPEVPLEKEDVRLEDIIQSYSRQVGHDISLLRIREAAKREGAVVEGSHEKLNNPPREAVVFQDHQVNAPLRAWLESMVRPKTRGRFKEMLNLSKMFAFYNPFFLPMYDVFQGATLGSFGPKEALKTAAVTPLNALGVTDIDTAITAGWKDVMNQTEEFWKADRHGLSSQPFSSPLQQSQREFRNAYLSGRHGGVIGKTLENMDFITRGTREQQIAKANDDIGRVNRNLLSRNKFVRGVAVPYELSWESAWFMDRLVRQVTYRHLRDNKGLSPVDAAQQAAEAHGDYASVPQQTRDQLNTVFFTPSFKIAMGKFFSNALRGVGEVVTNRENATSRMRAGVIMKSIGIMAGFDMMMLGLGFRRDEFGRSYCRPTDATSMPKEMCISWSTPLNLFSKYAKRVWDAFNGPTNFNSIQNLANRFRWELNPLWRVGAEWMQNKHAAGGQIYNELDPSFEKSLKSMKYIGTQIFALMGQFTDNQLGEKGREVVAEELGEWWSHAMSAFVFAHTRDTPEQRFLQQLEVLNRQMKQEVGLSQVQQMLRQGADAEEIREFIEGQSGRQEEYMRRLDNLLEKLESRNAAGSFDFSPDPPPDSQQEQKMTPEELKERVR